MEEIIFQYLNGEKNFKVNIFGLLFIIIIFSYSVRILFNKITRSNLNIFIIKPYFLITIISIYSFYVIYPSFYENIIINKYIKEVEYDDTGRRLLFYSYKRNIDNIHSNSEGKILINLIKSPIKSINIYNIIAYLHPKTKKTSYYYENLFMIKIEMGQSDQGVYIKNNYMTDGISVFPNIKLKINNSNSRIYIHNENASRYFDSSYPDGYFSAYSGFVCPKETRFLLVSNRKCEFIGNKDKVDFIFSTEIDRWILLKEQFRNVLLFPNNYSRGPNEYLTSRDPPIIRLSRLFSKERPSTGVGIKKPSFIFYFIKNRESIFLSTNRFINENSLIEINGKWVFPFKSLIRSGDRYTAEFYNYDSILLNNNYRDFEKFNINLNISFEEGSEIENLKYIIPVSDSFYSAYGEFMQ